MNICPKCGIELSDQDAAVTSCPGCGLDFSKTLDTNFSTPSIPSEAASSDASTNDEKLIEEQEDISTKDVDQFQPSQDIEVTHQSTQSVDSATEHADFDDYVATEVLDDDAYQDQVQPTLVADEPAERASDLDIPIREIEGADSADDSDREIDYELIKEVGRGATGIVYSATQKSLSRDVAIKMLAKQKQVKKKDRKTALKEKDIQKFLYESQITARLDHPNIIIVHDLGITSNETLFYSMKLLEGNEWQSTIKQNSLEKNLEIFDDVCDAIRYAHQNDIIHRDLKPQNVLVGQFGEVQVTDWGLAWDMKNDSGSGFSGGGTPCYMAPEMARQYLFQIDAKKLRAKIDWFRDNEHDKSVPEIKNLQQKLSALETDEQKWRALITEQSDVYVLGAILYHIAVGYPPHLFLIDRQEQSKLGSQFSRIKARKELEMASKRAIAKYKVAEMDDQVARNALKEIALEAMAFDQNERIPSVRKLQQRLREFRKLVESVRLSDLGATELENSTSNKDSYQNLASAQYYFQESVNSWPDNPKAIEGRATTTIKFAERALTKKDFGFGLSQLTDEAISFQADPTYAQELKRTLKTQKRRQDNRQRAFWIASAIASLVILGSFGVVYYAQLQTTEAAQKSERADLDTARAEKSVRDADAKVSVAQTKQSAAESKEAAATQKANVAAEREKTAIARERDALAKEQQANTKATEANQRATLAAEKETKANEKVVQANKDTVLASLQSRATRFELSRNREAAQLGAFLALNSAIDGDLKNLSAADAKNRILQVFADPNIPQSLKNSWEMHQLYKQANPAGTRSLMNGAEGVTSGFKLIRTSSNTTPKTIAVTMDNRIGMISDNQPFFTAFELDATKEINSADISRDGRWVVFNQNDPNSNTAGNLPSFFHIESGRSIPISADVANSLIFTSKAARKEQPSTEKLKFSGQYVQILSSSADTVDLLCVDRRVDSGMNQFRCSVLPLRLAGHGEFVLDSTREVLKTKVIGKSFANNPGTLTNTGCLVSGFRSDNKTKVAMIVGYPKIGVEFGLLVFDLDATSQNDSADVLQAMRSSVVELEFAPTSLLFASDDQFSTSIGGTGTLFIGGGNGSIVKILCSSPDNNEIALNTKTISNQSGHRTSIRDIQLGTNDRGESRIYSASRTEIIAWDPNLGSLEKRLFGHDGEIVGMNVVPIENGNRLVSLASRQDRGATTNELRYWQPDSTQHQPIQQRGRRDIRESSPIVAAGVDKKHGSNAIVYAFESGNMEYWDPDTQLSQIITNPSNDLQLSRNDWRSSDFEYFDDRWLVVYTNTRGLMVWDLKDTNQTKPVTYSAAKATKGEINTQNFMSASKDGLFIATSHPTNKSRIILWTKQQNGTYASNDLGPFGSETTGVEPIVSPDGQWVAVVARSKYRYNVELYRRSDITSDDRKNLIESPYMRGYTNYNNLIFAKNSSEIILAQDRASTAYESEQSNAARKIEMFRYQHHDGQWENNPISIPAALENHTQQISFFDVQDTNDGQYFLGIVGLSPAAYADRGLDAAQLGSDGARELVVWKESGVVQRQNVKFSRRLNPRFQADSGLVAYLDSTPSGRNLTEWNWAADKPVTSIISTNSIYQKSPSYWQTVGDGHIVIKGRDWMSLAKRDGNRFNARFNLSLANPAKKVELYGQTIVVHHADNSSSLIKIQPGTTPPTKPITKHLTGRDRAIGLSPDGNQLARLSLAQDEISVFDNQSLFDGADAPTCQIQTVAHSLTWQTTSSLADMNIRGGSTYKVVSATKQANGLDLSVWDGSTGAPLGTSSLPWGLVDGQPMPRQGEIHDLRISPVTGNYAAILWNDETRSSDIWVKGLSQSNPSPTDDETVSNPLSWTHVTNRAQGRVSGIDFSEVSIDQVDVASRIVIATSSKNGTENSVRVFLVQKSEGEQMGYELTQVHNVGDFQPIDSIQHASFSGDGRTLGTVTRDRVTLWLSDGWDETKAKSNLENEGNIVFTQNQIALLQEEKRISTEQVSELPAMKSKFNDEQINELLAAELITAREAEGLRTNNLNK